MSRSTQKLQPTFRVFLPQFIANRSFPSTLPVAEQLTTTTITARFLILRSTPGLQRRGCRIETTWHGVRFWSLSRTLWIECARSLQLPARVCSSVAVHVHLSQRLYICTAACTACRQHAFFFFFLPFKAAFRRSLNCVPCGLIIWNSVPLNSASPP